ncbi:hypothetical protein K469DRAFT_319150 [Zopfia rhizophila CBS 207.26]|uniref:Uncharacterized protein n=1 Tax=Zopfia rhizophila CBS 207.26 TaxID=1314779 RepID=A0A6A6ERS2_9PEZI|nr:hypothetical protein K469DRAFT_319150 [Zopfia rhizophila CBS 207.26]
MNTPKRANTLPPTLVSPSCRNDNLACNYSPTHSQSPQSSPRLDFVALEKIISSRSQKISLYNSVSAQDKSNVHNGDNIYNFNISIPSDPAPDREPRRTLTALPTNSNPTSNCSCEQKARRYPRNGPIDGVGNPAGSRLMRCCFGRPSTLARSERMRMPPSIIYLLLLVNSFTRPSMRLIHMSVIALSPLSNRLPNLLKRTS